MFYHQPCFLFFVNDLALGVKRLKRALPIGQDKLSILLYVDDIVLLAENEHDLQEMIVCMPGVENGDCINTTKTNIVHFRNRRKPRTEFHFSCSGITLDVVGSYTYLVIYLDEFLNFKPAVECLSDSSC